MRAYRDLRLRNKLVVMEGSDDAESIDCEEA
jgi:hypothetical protein